jgi:hypothetical protein
VGSGSRDSESGSLMSTSVVGTKRTSRGGLTMSAREGTTDMRCWRGHFRFWTRLGRQVAKCKRMQRTPVIRRSGLTESLFHPQLDSIFSSIASTGCGYPLDHPALITEDLLRILPAESRHTRH